MSSQRSIKSVRMTATTALLTLALAGVWVAQESTTPSLRIVAPADGAEIERTDVEVRLDVEGVELVGERTEGAAYVLLRLDDAPPVKIYSDRFTFQGVTSGSHTLRAELRRNDGSAYDPPVRSSVRFSVVSR